MSAWQPLDWPPLISNRTVPAWARLRDLVLTLMAWAFLFFLVRDSLALMHDYLRPPSFEFSNLSPPDWLALWGRLKPFAGFVAVLVLWLLFWSLVRGRAIAHTPPVPQPAPLPVDAHAVQFGLPPGTVAPWREARALVMHFDAAGQISHAESRGLRLSAPRAAAPAPAAACP